MPSSQVQPNAAAAEWPGFPDVADPGEGCGPDRFAIGDLARDFGLTARTIRFYEDEGLLTPIREGQARIYSRRDRARLSLICRGKRLGFSLAEIKQFLDLYQVDAAQKGQMRFALRRARERIASLEQQLRDVQDSLGELRGIERAILDHFTRLGEAPDGDVTDTS